MTNEQVEMLTEKKGIEIVNHSEYGECIVFKEHGKSYSGTLYRLVSYKGQRMVARPAGCTIKGRPFRAVTFWEMGSEYYKGKNPFSF